MRKLNLYSFHRNINSYRFDANNTQSILNELQNHFDVTWYNLDGSDKFVYRNDCEVLINQGSILIFEFDDTKEFKTFDFGDAPTLTMKLCNSTNFIGAAIGQYNRHTWNNFPTVKSSIYPESMWNLGLENFDTVQQWRAAISLDKRLYWRGSIYKNPSQPEYYDVRKTIEIMAATTPFNINFHFGNVPIQFEQYISEAVNFKLALSFGGGGGHSCGDFCFRDIEMYGLGIPTLRPKYIVETEDPLIPNVHYIAVDCEFDELFRYKNPELLAQNIIKRYAEVIDDDDFLRFISKNAREWYLRNCIGPNISYNIIKRLGLYES